MQECYSSTKNLSIKEVSGLIGLSASTLRNMESFFNIPIERNTSGQRIYTENIINIFKQIKKYTGEGLQYAEIKPLLNIAVEGFSSATPKIEVITEKEDTQEQNFNLIIKPFENRITELKTLNNELLEENKHLNRENATLIERVKNFEARLNRKWWRFGF